MSADVPSTTVTDSFQQELSAASTEHSIDNASLLAVITEVESYMRCTDLSLIRDGDDENFLIKLLLLGIAGGKEEDIRDPSILFDQLHSQGNRQVCQYQFKRYEDVS